MWSDSIFEKLFGETKVIKRASFWNGKEMSTSHACSTVILRDKRDGKKIIFSVIHLASGVEADLINGRNTVRTKAWRQGFRGWKMYVNKLARDHGVKRVVLTADWNVNLKLGKIRSLITRMAPIYRLAWKAPYPKMGTYHKRIIDFSIVRGVKVVFCHLLKDDNSSDHRPFIQRIS